MYRDSKREAAIAASRERARIAEIAKSMVEKYAPAPSGGAAAWGSITGTLSVQADLASALNAKASSSDITSGINTHAANPTAHHSNANDPSADEKAALAGTSGTPGTGNKYVTNDDPRLADSGGGVIYGTQANRPAAGTEGRLYMPTDGYYPAIDNGSSWDVYAVPGVKCTNPPAYDTFTKLAGGTGDTLVTDGDGLLLTQMGNNSTAIYGVAFLQSLISAPYTFVVGLEILALYPAIYDAIGICLTDGTSNPKVIGMHFVYSTTSPPGVWIAVEKYNSPTSFSATYAGLFGSAVMASSKIFFRIRDDNTNRFFEFSLDRRNWIPFTSNGRTDFLTATHCGLWLEQQSTAVATTIVRSKAKIFDWSLTSGA